MSQRKFGVEIEHISKFSHAQMVDELKRFGLVVDDYATGHTRCPNGCYSGWQVKTDGSITVQGDYGYGIELVSPPLGLNSLGELKAALGIANKYGAVNSSCGLHVHVHAPELYAPRNNMKSLDRIITEWGKIEQTVFSYMPLSRRGNANCKAGIDTSDRYQALNIDPLFSSRHTIEFRAHSASLNYDKISSWVMLCIKFVNRLATDKSLEPIDPKTILTVQPKIIKPKDGMMFYLHRPQPNWIIEADKKQHKFGDLKLAWDKLREPLNLPGLGYLPDFRFPLYGNAMTQLCHELDIRGMFRSYLEDRYDRVTKKFGFYDSTQNITTLFGEDEDDFYHEPDYVADESRRPGNSPTDTSLTA